MPDVPVPSGTRPSLLRRLAAWLRRGYDAELLAVAPAKDETGAPLVWDFAHPRNASPLWRLVRPQVWQFTLPIAIGWRVLVALLMLGSGDGARIGLAFEPSGLLRGMLVVVIEIILLTAAASRIGQRRWQRLALRAYRRHRWLATSALDATIRDALEHQRTPRRLLDARAPGPPA